IINLRRGSGKDLKIFATQEINDVYQLSERESILGSGIEYHPLDVKNKNKIILCQNISALLLPTLHWQRIRKILSLNKRLESHLNAFGIQLSMDDIDRRILISGDTLFPIKHDHDIYSWFAYQIKDKIKDENSPYLNPDNARQLGWKHNDLSTSKDDIISMIKEQCNNIISCYKNLEKSDIVCLHVGSLEKGFSELPNNIKEPKDIFEKRHDIAYCYPGFHLGIMGSVRLMEILIESNKKDIKKGFDCENGLIILTEFGEELLGNRQNICIALAEILKGIEPSYQISERALRNLESENNVNGIVQQLKNIKKVNAKDKDEFLKLLKSNIDKKTISKYQNIILEYTKIKEPSILPSEITLRLRLHHENDKEKIGMFCSYCGKVHDWQYSCGEEGPGEIITYLAKGPDGNKTYHNCTYWKK
ncbi:MAG: hypothetical protein ABSC53_13715, partial [Bacteroidota bacterium]